MKIPDMTERPSGPICLSPTCDGVSIPLCGYPVEISGLYSINRITVKKDGVYLSSHSSNDTAPFHSWRCRGLSEVYAAEGQAGLDREIIRMLYEYLLLLIIANSDA